MEIDIDKYDKESLEFIYSEAVNHLSKTFESFRSITNKSYLAIGVYFSVISYCITEILDMVYKKNDFLFYEIILSMLISSFFIFKNLLPVLMTMPGCKPERLIDEYYEKGKIRDNQLKNYYKQRLIDLNFGIEYNVKEIMKRSKRLRTSVFLALALIVLSFFIYVIGDSII